MGKTFDPDAEAARLKKLGEEIAETKRHAQQDLHDQHLEHEGQTFMEDVIDRDEKVDEGDAES